MALGSRTAHLLGCTTRRAREWAGWVALGVARIVSMAVASLRPPIARCRPRPPPPRRSSLCRQPHAQAQRPCPCPPLSCRSEGLSIFGVPAEIFCDAAAAAELEEGSHLVPCWGDPDDLTDRWDARWVVLLGACTHLILPAWLAECMHACTAIKGAPHRRPCRLLLDPLSLAASARQRRQPPSSAAAEEAAALAAAGASWEELERERYRCGGGSTHTNAWRKPGSGSRAPSSGAAPQHVSAHPALPAPPLQGLGPLSGA